jgi:ElaB/YqjD/DUF883 family membrane-anchored ribosome-binding protein
MREAFKGTRDRLEKDLQALIRDTKELLKSTAQNVSGEAQEVRKRLEDRLEGIQRGVQQKTQVAEDMMREGLEATDEVIHQYPYQAMGVSFVVGVLLGLMFRRR